jgi:hypothetical protein
MKNQVSFCSIRFGYSKPEPDPKECSGKVAPILFDKWFKLAEILEKKINLGKKEKLRWTITFIGEHDETRIDASFEVCHPVNAYLGNKRLEVLLRKTAIPFDMSISQDYYYDADADENEQDVNRFAERIIKRLEL